MIRLLVCGGRDYYDYAAVERALDRVHAEIGISLLIHGAARGADTLAEYWAKSRGVETLPFPALWRAYGYGAGPIRNQKMLDEGRPDKAVAFPGGPGTADMIYKARRAGIKVWEPMKLT